MVSLSIATTLYTPEELMPPAVREATATALVIATQAYFGVVHPPAGAAAFIFAQNGPLAQRLRWWYLVFPLLGGNVLFIVMAALYVFSNSELERILFYSNFFLMFSNVF